VPRPWETEAGLSGGKREKRETVYQCIVLSEPKRPIGKRSG